MYFTSHVGCKNPSKPYKRTPELLNFPPLELLAQIDIVKALVDVDLASRHLLAAM